MYATRELVKTSHAIQNTCIHIVANAKFYALKCHNSVSCTDPTPRYKHVVVMTR